MNPKSTRGRELGRRAGVGFQIWGGLRGGYREGKGKNIYGWLFAVFCWYVSKTHFYSSGVIFLVAD